MSTVDPFVIFSQIPKSLRPDVSADQFWMAFQRWANDMFERTGGATDEVGETSAAVVTLDGSVGTLETAVTALQATVNAIATGSPNFVPLNGVTTRAWDANAAAGVISASPTQAEVENLRDAVLQLSDVVATLADDLATKGVLG